MLCVINRLLPRLGRRARPISFGGETELQSRIPVRVMALILASMLASARRRRPSGVCAGEFVALVAQP
jgi:hypothetical protein